MTVTGDDWISLNLGQLVPELDPNNPGSFASLARDKINLTERNLQNTLTAINASLMRAADLVNHVRTASTAIKQAQASLEELVNNAANTGVYTHFLGICPDFPRSILKGNNDVVSLVTRIMNDKSDPCTPVFQGDTAYIGGFIMLVGAPNPAALWDKLKVIAEIFPALKAVVKDGTEKTTATIAEIADLGTFFSDIGNRFASDKAAFDKFSKTAPAGVPYTFNGCDKWICSTLKDIVPALDPNIPGSGANLALEFEKDLIDGVTSSMDAFAGFANTINRLANEINKLQSDIRTFRNQVLDFGEKLAATGVYFHAIGRDLSLTNTDEFVAAVAQSLNDTSDPGRPNFRGNTACMAGVLLVVGGPNATGLEKKLKNVGQVFRAFGDKYDRLNQSLDNIAQSIDKFQADFEPITSVPQLSIVNGEIVMTATAVSFSQQDPSVSTPSADGSGTAPKQVSPITGESAVPGPAGDKIDPTCPPPKDVTPVARKTSQTGELIREGRRRLDDLNQV